LKSDHFDGSRFFNPWGIAAPTGGDFPVVLDIALTTAGKGMMRWFEREGKKMPPYFNQRGWPAQHDRKVAPGVGALCRG